MTKTQQSNAQNKSEIIIAVLSLLGISIFLLLHYVFDSGHEIYTLKLHTSLVSALASVYEGQFIYQISLGELPLMTILILGGVPLLYQLIVKLFEGNFGADLLAGISIVTAVLLDEYLAGSLVVLMLSGGAVLESYAVKKASEGSRYFCESVFWASQPKQAAKT